MRAGATDLSDLLRLLLRRLFRWRKVTILLLDDVASLQHLGKYELGALAGYLLLLGAVELTLKLYDPLLSVLSRGEAVQLLHL